MIYYLTFNVNNNIIFEQQEDGCIRILSADPIIEIDEEYIYLRVEYTKFTRELMEYIGDRTYPKIGDIIKFKDNFGASFTYVLKEYKPLTNRWVAEWPD